MKKKKTVSNQSTLAGFLLLSTACCLGFLKRGLSAANCFLADRIQGPVPGVYAWPHNPEPVGSPAIMSSDG